METDAKGEVRKLRKKLRDIERLSKVDTRALNAEESEKVSKKAKYEERLRHYEGIMPSTAMDDAADDNSCENSSKVETQALPRASKVNLPKWAQLKYDLSNFCGHADVVKSLAASDCATSNLTHFVSTSSDTTAIKWQVCPKTVEDLTAESCQALSFNGHTSTVTCAIIVDSLRWFSNDLMTSLTGSTRAHTEPIKYLMTASLDCNICIWCLESGKQLFQMYTYQPITKLANVEVDLVLSGTETGKIELWNLRQKEVIYSTLFDQNATEVAWITRADDVGNIVACSRGDFLAVFELTSDPLVGAMMHQCYSSADLKTSRGESYVLRKVTAVVAHDSRIYLTTRHRPSIKSIGWDQGSLVVSRFAGRHFQNGSFLALNIWSPSEDDPAFLFAVEVSSPSLNNSKNTPREFAIHVHSLPHKQYALSNYYVGSMVVPFDVGSSLLPVSLNVSVGSMKLENKCMGSDDDAMNTDATVSPCVFCSVHNAFLVFSPSLYAPTVQAEGDELVQFGFSPVELHPKPSAVNLSMTQNDFSDISDERSDRSDRMTNEDVAATKAAGSKTPLKSSAKKLNNNSNKMDDSNINDNDSNPPTDVEDDDDRVKPELTLEQDINSWGSWKKVCSVL